MKQYGCEMVYIAKCVVCGEEANLYIYRQSICSRCDRQAQIVRRLRRIMDEQAKRSARPAMQGHDSGGRY